MSEITHGQLYTLAPGWEPGLVPQVGHKATVAERIESLRSEGIGEPLLWCDRHRQPALSTRTRCRLNQSPAPCRIVSKLILPLDTETSKETT